MRFQGRISQASKQAASSEIARNALHLVRRRSAAAAGPSRFSARSEADRFLA